MVAIQYSAGEGTTEDVAAAVEWFRNDIAHHHATAENFLGSMLLEDDGAPKDPTEGMRLLKLSAEQDNPAAFLNIGRAYLFGFGVPKDPNLGVQYYSRAAELGNEQAAYFVKWLGGSPGNRSFKDQNQVTAFQQIQLLRANALSAEQGGFRPDGSYRPGSSQRLRPSGAGRSVGARKRTGVIDINFCHCFLSFIHGKSAKAISPSGEAMPVIENLYGAAAN